MGLIGPNGAGKTTILKMITGEKKPDTGFIQLGNNVKWVTIPRNRNDSIRSSQCLTKCGIHSTSVKRSP